MGVGSGGFSVDGSRKLPNLSSTACCRAGGFGSWGGGSVYFGRVLANVETDG